MLCAPGLELIVDRQKLVAGVRGDAWIKVWCQHRLGAGPIKELFRGEHLSLVIGLGLADQRRVVVKARQAAAVSACPGSDRCSPG